MDGGERRPPAWMAGQAHKTSLCEYVCLSTTTLLLEQPDRCALKRPA